MKKSYIVASVLATMLLSIGCAPPKPKEIPPSAISEIYAMNEAKDIRDSLELKDVQDHDEFITDSYHYL